MTFLWAAIVIVVVAAAAIGGLLLVRRRAPEDGFFTDGDRAAGVFGVLATGFAIILGFVVFLAFESFDTSRAGAEQEAALVAQQFETAQFMPPAARRPLADGLVCYARSVVHQEWPEMRGGALNSSINPWSADLFKALQARPPADPDGAGGVRQVDRPAHRSRAGAPGPHPRRAGRHPALRLGRAVPDGRYGVRLHAVLRRPG